MRRVCLLTPRILALACVVAPAILACGQGGAAQSGYVIAGRVIDPLGLRPDGAILMVGTAERDGTFISVPVPIEADGSFATPKLRPATYVVELVRTPHSRTKPATVVGFSLVPVSSADVSQLTVEIRNDYTLPGGFRMESDDPAAAWPPHIVVNAFLALDGMPLLKGTVAKGAPAARFMLRSAFGPRVVRCGYTLAPGSRWWPTRILLDGVDVTNVPTDFGTHENGNLEVVSTQQPAGFNGTVADEQGRPATRAWVVAFAADRALWQQRSTMSQVVQADTDGAFRFQAPPGRYLVRALPPAALSSRRLTSQLMMRLAPGALAVDLAERELKVLRLTTNQP
jgi:hypothetical protein